ncbi:MAG: Fur family transcriptional regulator [Solirubrobacteraceae bacterium]
MSASAHPAATPTPASAATAAHADDLVTLLHERGQRATPQRLVILRALRRRAHHATADEIRNAVRAELPGTSTPTVYATLELLAELGLVRQIDAGSRATLYDARTEPHQHMVCRRCGRIDDLDGDVETAALLSAARATGFSPRAVELVISGLCRNCASA